MQTQINEHYNGGEDARKEHQARGLGRGLQPGGRFTDVGVGLKQEKADGGDYGGAGGIEKALQHIDSEHIGDGELLLAGQEEGADGFAGAAKEEDGGETGQGHGVNRPETRRAEILLENLPAQRAEGVASVNGYNGDGEKEEIGATQGVKKLAAAKIAEMKEAAGTIGDKSQDTETDNRE
jgi:hypothetical protein